ncbi:MAG: preprotein translocase subunit SecE [Acidimicrobiales bacterium]
MAMNRETKRMLQRQGELGPDGEPARTKPKAQSRSASAPVKERTTPAAYVHEVRNELRKVAWPTRDEVVRYSGIVLIALVVLTLFIFGLDYAFSKSVFFLFGG